MKKVLSPRQLAGYEEDGVICPVRVISEEEAFAFRRALEEQEKRIGSQLNRMDNCHLFFRWAYDLATHPGVLDVLEDLLGPDLFVHSTRIFYKHPHDPSYVSWHQDGTYSQLNSKPAPSAWIALSRSVVENGCLRVAPGSHRTGKLPHIETYAADNLLNHGEQVELEIDESKVRNLELEPGQMSLHHVDLIHGSKANSSGMARIGFAASYINPEVRRSHMPVVRARGVSNDHEFDLAEGPPEYSLDEGIAAHAEFSRKRGMRQMRVSVHQPAY